MLGSLTKWRLGLLAPLLWIADPNRADAGDQPPTPSQAQVTEGLRLFLTDWTNAGHGEAKGDGLGPVFNERSCVACHSQGGIGGAGGSRVNVRILTDTRSKRLPEGKLAPEIEQPPGHLTSTVLPAFATVRSLVLHRFSSNSGYEAWRSSVLTSFGLPLERGEGIKPTEFAVRQSFRNTPALFGAGLIDSIPEAAIETASLRRIAEFPEIKGRPGRLQDGRTGRFGWKAQTASLGDFVRVACANELGLENPGHVQPPDPLRPNYKAPGLDLTENECNSLASYIAALPRPVEINRPSNFRAEQITGREVFNAIGCAACHMPKLGEVEGIYSDLLLHDMGPALSDSGESYGAATTPILASEAPKGNEWRTPPLWGLRDSAPFLHDGRAANLAQAIASHGGEAQETANRYRQLGREPKHNLSLFLQSLTAPTPPERGKKTKKG